MRIGTFVGMVAALGLSSVAIAADADFLSTGHRLLVETEGRKDYKPRIVDCDASSIGLCLRDTRGTPANNPLEPTDDGHLRVVFDSWGIVYNIAPDGTGRTFNDENVELKPFAWSMIPE